MRDQIGYRDSAGVSSEKCWYSAVVLEYTATDLLDISKYACGKLVSITKKHA